MTTNHPPGRSITRLLIANRGEIATRILQTARELSLITYTLSTPTDTSHTLFSTHTLPLSSPLSYVSIDELIVLVKHHNIDAVHPGYGFLSESADFARRMWEEAGAAVIGPGWEILSRTGDKLQARLLAEECGVPVLPAMEKATGDVTDVRKWAEEVGWPVMVKAVDGGGGRGIRLVRSETDLGSAAKRAMEESPSKHVFAEKAAVDGFRHIEVQIVGDGMGNVEHLWERECSIQRRYQKVVEQAPSTFKDRHFVAKIINAAMRMARKVRYLSLGTFEFLANPSTSEFFFLEVNPRLQVEHTVTESISLLDIVKIQLEIAQGASLASTSLGRFQRDPEVPPPLHSIQLRITAEHVRNDWSLSIGKIQSFHMPSGNGVRVDTNLVSGYPNVINSDFDSLIAKIVVTAATWDDAIRKAKRAVEDTYINGVKTNLDILHAIASSRDFANGQCDTKWLELNLPSLLDSASILTTSSKSPFGFMETASASSTSTPDFSNSSVLFRKGDAWSIKLMARTETETETESTSIMPSSTQTESHHLKLVKVLRNEFPSLLEAEITYTTADSASPMPMRMQLSSTTATSSQTTSAGKHRRGDSSNANHVIIPFPGKLVEVVVEEGDVIQAGDVICVVQQMKMELEVRAGISGLVKWVTEVEDGEDVAEGTLVVEIADMTGNGQVRPKL